MKENETSFEIFRNILFSHNGIFKIRELFNRDPMNLLFNYGIIFSLVIDTCPKLIICLGSQTIVFSAVL